MRRSPADQLVVAVKPLLAGVGVEQRGRLTGMSIRSTGLARREETKEHANVESEAVRDPQAVGVGGVPGRLRPTRAPRVWTGRPGRVRGRSEEQPLQDLEPDVSGSYFPPPVRASRYRGRTAVGSGCSACRRSPIGLRRRWWPCSGGAGGAAVPPRLLWLPPEQVGPRRGRGVRRGAGEYDWVIDLGRPEVLRRGAVGPRRQGGAGGHRRPLGAAVCEAVAGRAAAAPGRRPGRARQGNPQGSAVSPILANLFMHFAFDTWMARNFPGCPFERYADDAVVHCASRRQAEFVLAGITTRMKKWGYGSTPTRRNRLLQGQQPPGQARAHVLHLPRVRLSGTGGEEQHGRERTSPSFLPAICPEALKAKSAELRSLRIHRRTTLTLGDLARWLNPIVAGWMHYYGRFYRSALYPLLRRVNPYLRRWAGKKHRRLRAHKRFQRWWTGLLDRARPVRPLAVGPHVLTTGEKSPVTGDCHAGI